MAISVDCGTCGRTLSAPDDAAGTARMCPNCGELVKIPDTTAGLHSELAHQVAAPLRSDEVRPSAPGQTTPPAYGELALVTTVLRVLALVYYGLAALALLLFVVALIRYGREVSVSLGLLVVTVIASLGALMHGLAEACVVLRDIARNSFGSRRLTEQVQAAAGATNEATDRVISVLEEQRDKLVETVASAARSLAKKLDERGRDA
ncbi:MAG: hypothetical protein PVJ57_15165 [Phycisphaerae bacterium]|jgi:hypothetical protein